MSTPSELRAIVTETFPKWLQRSKNVPHQMDIDDLKDWLGDGDDHRHSVGRYQDQISHYKLKEYIVQALQGQADNSDLGLIALLASRQFFYSVAVQDKNTNSGVAFGGYANTLALLITVGWREQAELYARYGLEQLARFGIRRGSYAGGALGIGVTFDQTFPYFMMDLAKDWLGANISTLTTYRQNEIPDLGGWSELLQNWREHNLEKFNDILNRAADFHVEQSHDMVEKGRDDEPDYVLKHFEIEDDKYWIFPVLLLAVLRLREWEGIKNPELTHDLFWVSPLGRLPEVPPISSDQFYDAVDAKFRKMFPQTPSLDDLSRIRANQS